MKFEVGDVIKFKDDGPYSSNKGKWLILEIEEMHYTLECAADRRIQYEHQVHEHFYELDFVSKKKKIFKKELKKIINET